MTRLSFTPLLPMMRPTLTQPDRARMLRVADELLDIVDANDDVIAQGRRGDIHARGLLHRAVHILVTRDDGQLFLQQRALSKDMAPGLWDSSAAGHVEAGETYVRAAVRELGEELALHNTTPRYCGALTASAKTGFEFVRVYHLHTNVEPVADRQEIMATRWIGNSELERWLQHAPHEFSECFRVLLQQPFVRELLV